MKKYRDEIAMACYEIVKDGHTLGIINDAEMKEFEADCFVHEPEPAYQPEKPIAMEHATA